MSPPDITLTFRCVIDALPTDCYRRPNMNAAYWIEKLDLLPHPEGGCYREMYRSTEPYPAHALPNRFPSDRTFSTAIYFLLQKGEFSAFHRIKSDELWHHYEGGDLEIITIDETGAIRTMLLGKHQPDASPMRVVPHGTWFAARLASEHDYVLCGCTVAPGFDFADFEMAERAALKQAFPQHSELIDQLTPAHHA